MAEAREFYRRKTPDYDLLLMWDGHRAIVAREWPAHAGAPALETIPVQPADIAALVEFLRELGPPDTLEITEHGLKVIGEASE